MTESFSVCLTPDQLKSLLDGSLTEPEQTALQVHVDGCPSCQAALERLVAGSESWDAAVGHLREETPQLDGPVLAEALQQMKRDEFVDAAWQQANESSHSSTKPLDFLEPSDQPGSIGKLGVYEVSEVVGRGGMGVVLKAFDPSLHRVVAVKVLAPYLAHNPQARKRFIREAQAIAAVCHDHVITIHAIDESAEQPKIVMQFIAGRSLQEKLDADGSLDLKEILRIGMQTASGLAAAHAQGLVHRDVKPSNILLENGIQRVKLTDFGLARAVDDASLTQSGVIAGTPQYMAPEQANGDAVDHRADLFSLGSVMYAMCVGHSPFRASTTMGVLKRVCHDPARPIQELNPDIPDWLCAIIMKLLSKEREARFPTAKSVAEVLEKWLAHVQQPSVVPRPSPVDAAAPRAKQATSANVASAATGAVPPEWAYSLQDASRRLADSRTILFQTISPRLLLFLFVSGMAGSYAFASERRIGSEESLVVSVLGGLFVCFWGLLFVSLVRLVRANVYGASEWMAARPSAEPHSTNEHHTKQPRSLWSLPPESLAMLAALVTMVFGGHFFFAVIVAIVVWRVATYYARVGELQPAALVDGDATRVDAATGTERPTLAARIHAALLVPAVALQRLGEAMGNVFDLDPAERNRLLIAIGWCFAGGMDVIGSAYFAAITMKESGGDAPIGFLVVLLSLGLILLSLAVAQCIYVRQNFNHVRGASVIGLLPISFGAFLRIPLSVITLLWLHAPSVRASFATTPWPETDLGRLLGGEWSQSLRRWIRTLGRTAAWSVLCFVVLMLTLALYVIPFGPSDYYVHDDSAEIVMSKGDGPQFGFSMRATGTGRTYGLLPPAHVYLRDTILLTAKSNHLPAITNRSQLIPGIQVRLGYPATTNKGGRGTRQFTMEHCQELFQEISGQPHPQHAESLFQTIQWINAARDSVPSSQQTPAEQFYSFPSISVEDWINRVCRTFLHAEPLHANRPLPGFTATSTLLNKELFEVRPGAEQHVSNSCMTTPWLLIPLFIGFPLVWLMGVWRIVRRRHGTRVVKLAEAS